MLLFMLLFSENNVKVLSLSLKWLRHVGLTPWNTSLVPSKTVKPLFEMGVW